MQILNIYQEKYPAEQLSEEIHKPIVRKYEKRKVYSSFKDNIWGKHLANMQIISKYNEGIRFLL